MQGQFRWRLGPDISEDARLFDPYSKTAGQSTLADNPQLLALYQALTMDFYRPSYLGYLFKSVYPDEKFNPTTSPPRVLQLLKRLDLWFKKQNLPVSVHFKKSAFSLTSDIGIYLVIHRGQIATLEDKKWSAIKSLKGSMNFTTLEVAQILKISKTTSQRLIQKGLLDKKIKTVGTSAHASYQFINKKTGRS